MGTRARFCVRQSGVARYACNDPPCGAKCRRGAARTGPIVSHTTRCESPQTRRDTGRLGRGKSGGENPLSAEVVSMHPKTFIAQRNVYLAHIKVLQEKIALLEEQARSHPLPAQLRPATAADIVVDAVLWYPQWDSPQWNIVETVRAPYDAYKAYESGGCRYGLKGAFVEIEGSP